MSLSVGKAKLIKRLHRRRSRAREGMVLVEGVRAVGEALSKSPDVRFSVVAPDLGASPEGLELRERLSASGEVLEVDQAALTELTSTTNPQGVLLVVREPRVGLDTGSDSHGPVLILDGIQDPGNVGTLIRTARAMAVGTVICLDGTADPWIPKAVRASAGAVFGIPVVSALWEETRDWISREGVTLLAGDVYGSDVAAERIEGRWGLVLGNEGAGVRDGVRDAAHPVCVPMPGGFESLNVSVAGAILLYALTQPIIHSPGGP